MVQLKQTPLCTKVQGGASACNTAG